VAKETFVNGFDIQLIIYNRVSHSLMVCSIIQYCVDYRSILMFWTAFIR